MIATRSEMRTEAVSRRKMWGVLPVVIDDFLNGTLNKSEDNGILFYLNDEEKSLLANLRKRAAVLFITAYCPTLQSDKCFRCYMCPDTRKSGMLITLILKRRAIQ